MVIVLPSAMNGAGLNRGTTERSSFEFGSSLTDSCMNEENTAINRRTVERGLRPEAGQRTKVALVNRLTANTKQSWHHIMPFKSVSHVFQH